MENPSFDYVIVGAGAAGCVLAHRLCEDGRYSVCLLEAGPSDLHPFIHIPAGFIYVGHNPNYTWDFSTEPSEGSAGRRVTTRMGRTLGGSSSINGFNYTRGQPEDFDQWAALGNQGWRYQDILPYFKRSERFLGQGDPSVRGRDGLLPISDCDWRHPLCDAFIESAGQYGLPTHVDYNRGDQTGAGYYQRWIHKGRRFSAATAFLNPAKATGRLTIKTSAHVNQILFEGKRAVGVSYQHEHGGAVHTVHAKREVILSAGAANTPKILQLSGVGPVEQLQKFGIPVVHASEHVGQNFQDHYMIRTIVRVKGVTTINHTARGIRLMGEIAKWLMGKPSVITISPSVAFAFTKSRPELALNDLQFHFSPGSYASGVAGQLDNFPGMTLGFYQLRPTSAGQVSLRSRDPFDLPLVQPNYLQSSEDQQVAIDGLRLSRHLMHSAPLMPYIERDEFPPASAASDSELLDCARQRGTTGWHFMGTCSMGKVVDAELRVKGMDALRIVDASIMPTMPSGNTGAPTMMVAEKAADLILGKAPLAL